MSPREPQSPKQRYEREIEEILSRSNLPNAEKAPQELDDIEREKRQRAAGRSKPSRPPRPKAEGPLITPTRLFAVGLVFLIAAIFVRPLFAPLGLAALAMFAWGYYLSFRKKSHGASSAPPVKRWRGEIVDDGGRRGSAKPSSRLKKWLGKK